MDAYCLYVGDQTRPTAHNSTRTTNIESLPDDVILDILARVPAHDILFAAKLVSRKWYQMILTRDFVCAQHQQSTCGLLIQHDVATQQKGQRIIEISKYKFTGDVLSSCNGLILEQQYGKHRKEFCITNPTTKQHLDLSLFPLETENYDFSVIACDVASKEFKVVVTIPTNGGERECAIFTVGVDKDWKRRVDIKHLSPIAKLLLGQRPLTTQGFVHWAADYSSTGCFPYVLTLNIETEIITQFPAASPSLCGYGGETKLLYRYLPMGSCLSVLIARADEFPILDQIWEMEPETGEWTKMMSIDSESQKRALQGKYTFYPVGWLKFREVLVFKSWNWSSNVGIAYNVRTHEIESSFELENIPKIFFVHRNSLIWLD